MSSCKYFQLVLAISVSTTDEADEGINNTEIYNYIKNISTLRG